MVARMSERPTSFMRPLFYEADEATQANLFDDHFSQETHDPAW